jgi:hypothetical protein
MGIIACHRVAIEIRNGSGDTRERTNGMSLPFELTQRPCKTTVSTAFGTYVHGDKQSKTADKVILSSLTSSLGAAIRRTKLCYKAELLVRVTLAYVLNSYLFVLLHTSQRTLNNNFACLPMTLLSAKACLSIVQHCSNVPLLQSMLMMMPFTTDIIQKWPIREVARSRWIILILHFILRRWSNFYTDNT